MNEAGDDAEEIEVARTTLLLLSHEITGMWQDLLTALGGEAIPNGSQAHTTDDDEEDDDGLI